MPTGNSSVGTTIKLRRDTSVNWNNANPVLDIAEPGLDTTNNLIKYGDGVTAWANLPYAGSGPIVSGNLIPSADAVYDLGNATNRWRSLYVTDNGIFIGSVTMTTSGNVLSINGSPVVLSNTAASFTTVSASGNITSAANIAGTYIIGNASALTSITGANVTGTVANATSAVSAGTAGTVTTAAQPNITSVGTLTSLTVTGNATGGNVLTGGQVSAAGNVTGNYILGNGALLTGVITSVANINNGTSNVSIYAANANVAVSVDGTANVAVFATSGEYITGVVSATGNVTGSSLIGLEVTASGNVTGGNVLTGGQVSAAGNITGGNVLTGGVVTATGNVTSAANIQGGNLRSTGQVTATGNITGGNLLVGNLLSAGGNIVSAANIAGGNLGLVGQISAGGNITGANINSNAVVGANLTLVSTGAINLQPTANVDVNNRWIINLADPSQAQDAATKAYVDAIASNVHYHQPANAATTTSLANTFAGASIVYNNGASGVGANLVMTGNTYTIIDGVNIAVANNRILIKNEANAVWNGIYTYSNSTVITRSVSEDIASEWAGGDTFFVLAGTENDNTQWVQTDLVTAIGTSNISFVQIGGAVSYTAGSGLSLTGTQFNACVDGVTTAVNGSNQISVKASANLTTPNIGAATGTSLSVSGNILTSESISSTGNITSAATLKASGAPGTGVLAAVIGNISNVNLHSQSVATMAGNANGSVQFAFQNYSGSANASTDLAIYNDLGSDSTYFIDMGIVSSTYDGESIGANVFGANDGYLYVVGNSSTGPVGTGANVGNLILGATNGQVITWLGNTSTANIITVVGPTGFSVTGQVSATANIAGGNLLTGGLISATSNITSAANIAGGNVLTGGLVSATGNVTGNYILGNGALLTGVITSVANINNGTSNVTVVSSGGNVSVGIGGTGNVAVFATSGEYVSGEISATGNITGNILLTSGSGGNITGANVVSATTVTATGNISGGNLNSSGLISATGTITGGNIQTAGLISAAGNITGNNVTTAGIVTGNMLLSNKFIETPYRVVAPQGIQNQGTGLLVANGTLAVQARRMTISPNGLFAYSSDFNLSLIQPYSINQSTGALTALATTALNSGTQAYSVAVNPRGTFLFVGVVSNATIQVFSIDQATGLLTYSSTYSLVAGTSPRAMIIDPTGRFLYVTSYSGTPYSLYQLNIDQSTGALTTGSSVVIGSLSTNYKFDIEPTGRFLYISIIGVGSTVNTVEVYSINQSTGALTLVQSIASGGTQPQGLAVDPSGRFVYVAIRTSGTVGQFSINQSTGQLTSIASPIAAGTNPLWVEIDPSGRFVYVANFGAATFSVFSIDQVTGSLSSVGTVSLISGTAPNFILIDPTGRFAYGAPDGSVSISQYLVNNFSAGQANIVSINTGNLSVTANIAGGNLTTAGLISATGNITGNYFIGNGSQLTGITSYGNADVAAYLPTYTGNLIALTGNVITTANVTGGNLLTSGTARIAFGPSNAQTDVNLIALTQALVA